MKKNMHLKDKMLGCKNAILFNMGCEVALRLPNSDKKISVKKYLINGKVFGITQFRTSTVLIDKNTLDQMIKNC